MSDKVSIRVVHSIKLRRVALGYSQEYMAMKLQISQNSYSKIEIGKTQVELNRYLIICELLDMCPVSLLAEHLPVIAKAS